MKHLSIKLLVAVAAIVISANLFAANPSESVNTTNLVEVESMKTTAQISTFFEGMLELQLLSMEERMLKVKIENDNPNTTATGKIMVVSNDGNDEYGPYVITEGEILEVTVDQREWTVQEIESSEGSIITSWY